MSGYYQVNNFGYLVKPSPVSQIFFCFWQRPTNKHMAKFFPVTVQLRKIITGEKTLGFFELSRDYLEETKNYSNNKIFDGVYSGFWGCWCYKWSTNQTSHTSYDCYFVSNTWTPQKAASFPWVSMNGCHNSLSLKIVRDQYIYYLKSIASTTKSLTYIMRWNYFLLSMIFMHILEYRNI